MTTRWCGALTQENMFLAQSTRSLVKRSFFLSQDVQSPAARFISYYYLMVDILWDWCFINIWWILFYSFLRPRTRNMKVSYISFLYRQSNSLCVPLWIMMVLARDVWSIASMDEQSDLPTFAVSLLFIHLFHLFIRSFIYSIIYPFIHLLLYWMVHLLTLTSKFHQHIFIFILIHSSIHSFLHIMDNVHTHTILHLCM